MLLMLEESNGRSSTFSDHLSLPSVLMSMAERAPSRVLTSSKKLHAEV
jgi:hypothetical protein